MYTICLFNNIGETFWTDFVSKAKDHPCLVILCDIRSEKARIALVEIIFLSWKFQQF